MAILLIALAFIGPTLSGFFRGQQLNSEARRLLSLTRHAQSRAVSEGVPMILWIDPDQRRYGLQADPGYLPHDTNVLAYVLNTDLAIEVSEPLYPNTVDALAAYGQWGGRLSMLRFLPDGFIADSSPYRVQLRNERQENAPVVWLVQGSVNYELQTPSVARR